MDKIQQIILFTNSFTLGLLVPLHNLILLEKGADIQTLPILLIVYSITLLSFELPSGICADLLGRKVVFLISCFLQFISFLCILLATNFSYLVLAMIFNGLGRAFASGSLDALFIDQTLKKQGDGHLSKITTRIALLEGWGLAFGGIMGGFIAQISGDYIASIIAKLLFLTILFLLCLMIVKEDGSKEMKQRIPLREHLKKGGAMVHSSSKFKLILGGVFLSGFMIMTVETYWQPAFRELYITNNGTWLLGIITFFGFMAITIGNTISNILLIKFKNKWWKIYNICRFNLGACIILFGISQNEVKFVFWYVAVYMLFGTSNVVESTLINKIVPGNLRASILSLNSLIFQLGAMCASVFSSFSITYLKFSGIWIIAGIFIIGYAITVMIAAMKQNSVKCDN
ncbi:putative MFS family arabinose efflux permease [Mobilisporobacter senegalensis]|uniref:Putative MFS family arabinose efflux permease n=1 Tax=Mobilisporobacter senegalensis TaxID=1329262 RepID=A0A3N1XM76_9FIRM|nr:MFS transporter [Mobilisporobacter senegalensis]ROR27251.1 putative MFS family arabinose efflux permease [Mobilisporobacter senegalensis]